MTLPDPGASAFWLGLVLIVGMVLECSLQKFGHTLF